ncbi:MAG: hypothetical protein ACI8RZ_007779, partial [Myxococcota bacterium]
RMIGALSAIGLHGEAADTFVALFSDQSALRLMMMAEGLLQWCPLSVLEAHLPVENRAFDPLRCKAQMREFTTPETLAVALCADPDPTSLKKGFGFSTNLRAQTARLLLLQVPLPLSALRKLSGALADQTWQDPELLAVFCTHGAQREVSATWRYQGSGRSHPGGVLPLLATVYRHRLIDAARQGLPKGPVLVDALLDAHHSVHIRGQILRLMTRDEHALLRPHLPALLIAVPTLIPALHVDELPAEAIDDLLDVMFAHDRLRIPWLVQRALNDDGHHEAILSRALAGLESADPAPAYQFLRILQLAGVAVPPFPEPTVSPRRRPYFLGCPLTPARPLMAKRRLQNLRRGGSVPESIRADPETATVIREDLSSASPAVRLKAVQWAAQLPVTPMLYAALLDRLDDPDRTVREATCQALGRSGTEAAIPHLCRAAIEAEIRADALDAISWILQRRPPR